MSNLQVVNNNSNITESNLNPEMEINFTVDVSSAISQGSEVLEQSREENTAGKINPFGEVTKVPQVDNSGGGVSGGKSLEWSKLAPSERKKHFADIMRGKNN